MSRIDYSKWDKLNYSSSSSSEEEDDEKEKTQKVRAAIAHLSLSSSQGTNSSSSPLWNGLVLHHKDVFVSHVLSKLTETDRFFFAKVNGESQDVLKYAGVNVSRLHVFVYECSSISTLEFAWNHFPWGKKDTKGNVIDQALFCSGVAETNKLVLLKWAREVKQCEWNEWTIIQAAIKGNLEMLKYCFSNDCPCDEKESCCRAAIGGHLDCLRFLFDIVKISRDMERYAAQLAAAYGRINILKYVVEERKISEEVKESCVASATKLGRLDCLKYLFGEEARAPLNDWRHIASARYYEHPDCVNYLLEKGCPEPTDEEYARFVEATEKAEARAREREAAS
jgi:hypothetical protein